MLPRATTATIQVPGGRYLISISTAQYCRCHGLNYTIINTVCSAQIDSNDFCLHLYYIKISLNYFVRIKIDRFVHSIIYFNMHVVNVKTHA